MNILSRFNAFGLGMLMAVVAAGSTPLALAEIRAMGQKDLKTEVYSLRDGRCNKTFPYECRIYIRRIIAILTKDSLDQLTESRPTSAENVSSVAVVFPRGCSGFLEITAFVDI